jgi:hypothetical protein
MSKPNIFDNSKYYRHNEPIRSYEDQAKEFAKGLIMTEHEIDMSTDAFMRKYDRLVYEFENKTKLNKLDLTIMVFAAGIQVLRWAMISNSSLLGDIARPDAANVDKWVDNARNAATNATQTIVDNVPFLPPTLPELVQGLFLHQVPYDAISRSERFMLAHPGVMPGLSGSNHRYKTLGHDPIAGFIFGTANIATKTISVNEPLQLFPSYHVKDMKIDACTDMYHILKWTTEMVAEHPEIVGGALITQAVHIGTDVFTKAGLPIPLINVISPETSRFLMGHHIDTLSVARSAALAIMVNKIVEMFHKLFYDKRTGQANLYEVKTRKVVMYSNVMSSLLNVGYVAGTGDMNHLDIGGIAVTLWRVLTDRKRIKQIKAEFIERELDNDFQKQEDEIKQRLAVYGFNY